MTKEELEYRQLIFTAFYRVIRIGETPTNVSVFLATPVKDTMPTNKPVPGDWPDMWWESLALEIQKSLIARQLFWRGLSATFLKMEADQPGKEVPEKGKTWEEVAADGQPNLASLELIES